MVSADPAVQEQILREALHWASEMDMNQPAPVMGQRIHRQLRKTSGMKDPYRSIKDRQNRMALALLPELRAKIEIAADPLMMALRLAIAGNVIDLGVSGDVTEGDVYESVNQALTEPLAGDQNCFLNSVSESQRILYLTDNAGEIAFDRLLVEQLTPTRVTVAVRGGPVINDATIDDARAVGLHEIAEIIDNGSDAPGTLLDECSPEFKRRFDEADLIIAKGQGNFETLSEEPNNIFFLFKAKCSVIAARAGVRIGTHVLAHSRAMISESGAVS
jgi:hypothetical protein